jgi:choice-of-anchor A domain-containing protein
MKLATLLFAALLVTMAAAQSSSSSNLSQFSSCSTLLLNGTDYFDIVLLGSSSSSSASSFGAAVSPAPLLTLSSSLIGGRIAVNGSASLANTIIGSGLDCSSPSASSSPAASPSSSSSLASISLLVTGDLTSSFSQLACGGVALNGSYSGQLFLAQSSAANLTGLAASSDVLSFDFSYLGTDLASINSDLCGLTATNNFSIDIYGNMLLDASSSSSPSSSSSNVAIFDVPASAFSSLNSIILNGTSSNPFVIINVVSSSSFSSAPSSSNLTLSMISMNIGSFNSSRLLWNFCNATGININNMLMMGTLFAPRAAVSFTNAELEGGLIASSLTGSFFNEVSNLYVGYYCPSPSPSASPSASPSVSPSSLI